MKTGLLKKVSYAFLVWESFWRAFWPFAVFAGLVLAVFLFDLLPSFHWSLHTLVLIFLAAGGLYLLWTSYKRFRWPDKSRATRRIEQSSGLKHRPLSARSDIEVQDKNSPLWKAHQAKLKASLSNLKVGTPSPGVPRMDKWAFRVVPLILLLIAIPLAWGDAFARLNRAVSPALPKAVPAAPFKIDAWVSPPTYTGLAPYVIEVAAFGETKELELPQSSELLMQVQGGSQEPSLWQDGLEQELGLSAKGARRFEAKLERSQKLDLYDGAAQTSEKLLVSLNATVVPDAEPKISHKEEPRTTEAGSLRLEILGEEDYGFKDLKLEILRADKAEVSDLIKLHQVASLGLPKRNAKVLDFTEFLDLAAHPLAGEEVALELSARDFADQEGRAEAVTLTLPVYTFENPLAKQIAKLRHQLFKRPEASKGIAVTLAALAEHPDLETDKDASARDALTDLSMRLDKADNLQDLDQATVLMWDLARSLDDNPIRRAEEKLRKLEEQLREALERGAPEEELLALMDQLREAMEEYKQAVINQKLAEMMESGELNLTDQSPQFDQMENMAQQLEDMARKGARDEALDMLDELKEMMENLKNAELQLNMQPNGMPNQSQSQQMLNELGEIMKEQQEMLNDSFRQQQQGVSPNSQRDRESSLRQESLRRRLGESMKGLSQMFDGEMPEGMSEANQAMRDAAKSLFESDQGSAAQQQGDALNAMQQAAQSIAEMMAEQGQGEGQGKGQGQQGGQQGQSGQGEQGQNGEGQGQKGQGQQPGQNGNQGGTDPLGREYGEGDPLDLSPEGAKKITRDIRDELRKRAGETERSQKERSYVEDLLKEF